MERKHFLKNGLAALGLAAIAPLANACKKETDSTDTETDASSGGSSSGSCTVSPTETEGPFPTKSPASYVRSDIRDDRTGVALTIKITIKNKNNSCAALSGVLVDIWHCDKDGYYSGYSNTGYLGTQDNTALVFCRGLQYTDSAGLAKFTSIYPGWYTGRVTHIHAQIYVDSSLKLTTQIAFPDAINTAVYKTSLYSAHGQNSITNAQDNIIMDSLDNELATVTANSTTGGYNLTHTIYISA